MTGEGVVIVGTLAVSIAFVAVASIALARRASVRVRDLRPANHDPLVLVGGLGAVLVLGVSFLGFALIHDDFSYLLRASTEPWSVDSQMRLVGVQIPFWLALRLGHPEVICAALNVMAAVACGAALAKMLLGAGWTSSESGFAAVLFLSSRPMVELATWGAGFQQLAAWAMVFVILHAARRAALDDRERWAWVMLAIGAGGIAALTKWPFAWIAVPGAWMWIQLAPADGRSVPVHWGLPAGVGVFMLVPLLAVGFSAGGAGMGRFLVNMGAALDWLSRPVFAVLVALVVGSILRPVGEPIMRHYVVGRAGVRWCVTRSALIMAPVFVVPFLFNPRYFAVYYVGPATAWLAAAASPVLLSVLADSRRGWAIAVMFVLLWMPLSPILDIVWSTGEGQELAAFLEDVHRAVDGRTRADGLFIEARCASEEATHHSNIRLTRLFDLSERGDGVRWVTGWTSVRVAVGPSISNAGGGAADLLRRFEPQCSNAVRG